MKPIEGASAKQLSNLHQRIRQLRTDVKSLDDELAETQEQLKTECDEGSERIQGYIIAGKGLRAIPHLSVFEGNSRDDILWGRLARSKRRSARFTVVFALVAALLCVTCRQLAWFDNSR